MTAPGVLITPEALDELLTIATAGIPPAKFSQAMHRRAGNARGEEFAGEAAEALRLVCVGLDRLGAKDKGRKSEPVNPLAELARVENSRSEAQALLDSLRGCLQLAEDLDIARGDVLNDPVNGFRGTEWNDRLVQLCAELSLELHGPSKAVTGARE